MRDEPRKLRLNTIQNARKTTAKYLRFIAEESEESIDFHKMGLVLSFLKEYRMIFQAEEAGDLNKRLSAIEDYLEVAETNDDRWKKLMENKLNRAYGEHPKLVQEKK